MAPTAATKRRRGAEIGEGARVHGGAFAAVGDACGLAEDAYVGPEPSGANNRETGPGLQVGALVGAAETVEQHGEGGQTSPRRCSSTSRLGSARAMRGEAG